MANSKQNIEYPWSRLKNGLVELQRWWPAHIKNDSTNGLTIDPVLYATDFGPNTRSQEGGLEDEANTAGVRIECVNDDGTAPQYDAATTLGLQINGATASAVMPASVVGFPSAGQFTLARPDGTLDTITYTGNNGTVLSGCTGFHAGTTYASGAALAMIGEATCTVEISGSGTYSPKAKITDTDGKTYEFYLIAPSGEGVTGSGTTGDGDTIRVAYGLTANNNSAWKASGGSPTRANTNFEGSLKTSGPFPVFMTVQEFAEMIDTYRHVGKADNTKPAWLPHGMVGRTHAASNALPSFEADPRLSNAQDFPTDWRFRASVFMPMMLDVNQFDKRTTGANTSFAWPANTENSAFDSYAGSKPSDTRGGISRHSPDPDSTDVGRWKELGYSGDHLHGAVGGWSKAISTTRASLDGGSSVVLKNPGTTTSGDESKTIGFGNPDISLDTSAAIGPKYRMRMALAAFLKDGTYTVTGGGSIIPYIYDSSRTIGGKNTETLYAVWDGKNGHGNSQPYQFDCSAQIYPMFDFVQGPLAPASQGNNFDSASIEGEASSKAKITALYTTQNGEADRIQPRQHLVRPNPFRIPIKRVSKGKNGDASLANNTELVLITDATLQEFTGGLGMPVYISGLTGSLGSGANNIGHERAHTTNEPVWSSNDANGSWHSGTTSVDHNGWWIVKSVAGISTASVSGYPAQWQKIVISVNYRVDQGAVAEYAVSDAYICQGRLGGFENKYNTTSAAPQNLYGIGRLTGTTGPVGCKSTGFGTGFTAGLCQPDSSSPAGASSDSTYPARPTIWYPSVKNSETGNYDDGQYLVLRDIQPLKPTDDMGFTLGPTQSSVGGGVLRIPPPIGWDLAFQYYSGSENLDDPSVIFGTNTYSKPDYVYAADDNPDRAGNDRWGFRGIHIPFWSYVDGVKGRHAWDYIKPNGWSFGRNRPWPAQERVGTRAGYFAGEVEEYADTYGLAEWGCSPVWIDVEMSAYVPVQTSRLILIEFDNNVDIEGSGRHSLLTQGGSNTYLRGHGFYPIYDGSGNQRKTTEQGNWAYGGNHGETTTLGNSPAVYTTNRPAVYAWGSTAGWFTAGWDNSETEFPIGNITNNMGFGGLGNGSGYGTATSITEGMNTIRTLFTDAGMQLILNGTSVGTDLNSASPMWGMVIKVCDSIAIGGAEPDNSGTTTVNNLKGQRMFAQNPNHNPSQKDLQIDQMVLRQIPTNSMLPFNVDTINQKVTTAAKYNSLQIEADNISESKGMRVRVSIMQPPSKVGGTIEQEASTAYEGFDNIDPFFVGGIGSVNLSNLPASAITNGFMVRFHFYIPDNTQTSMHPIDWNSLPIIRNWTVKFDQKPTSSIICTANTFNDDTSSPMNTKVGHVLSFRATGVTTDADRAIASVKFNFGDGEETGFISLADQTLQSNTLDVAHVYTKAGTFAITCTVKDDAGNESAASSALSAVVAETKPVAVLRATPAQLATGSAVTFDATSSYIVSSDAARTIATYTFTAGDGSNATTQTGATLSHTYSSAGEYQATLTVTDNASSANTSTAAKAVIKVVVADATVDLFANLNTKPASFKRSRRANLSSTPTLDGTLPEVRDLGSRTDEFELEGSFLKQTANADIEKMELYLANATLLTIKWQATDFNGNASVKTFVGRMTGFSYDREGGKHGETPYTASFRAEE